MMGWGAGDKGQRAEGRGQRAEGRGQRAEGRGQRAEGRGQRAEGRGQRGRPHVGATGSWGERTVSAMVPAHSMAAAVPANTRHVLDTTHAHKMSLWFRKDNTWMCLRGGGGVVGGG